MDHRRRLVLVACAGEDEVSFLGTQSRNGGGEARLGPGSEGVVVCVLAGYRRQVGVEGGSVAVAVVVAVAVQMLLLRLRCALAAVACACSL